MNDHRESINYALSEIYEAEIEHVPLTPSPQGRDCLGNGTHEGYEIACDNCDHFLECFPEYIGTDWMGKDK